MHIKNDNPAYGADMGAFAGIPTFMRQPASRNLEGIDVAVVGIPYDGGAASFRSGTRMGPRKIREYKSMSSIRPTPPEPARPKSAGLPAIKSCSWCGA